MSKLFVVTWSKHVALWLLFPLLNVAAGPTTRVAEIDAGASGISAELKDVSAQEIFDTISRKAGGSPIQLQSNSAPPGNLDNDRFSATFEKQPYWETVLEVCEQAGLVPRDPSFNFFERRQTLHLVPGKPRPTHIEGPLLFALEQLSRGNSITYGKEIERVPDRVRLVITVMPEPKLQLLCRGAPPRVTQVVDDAGNELKPVPAPDLPPFLMSQVMNNTLGISLIYPDKAGKKIKTLRGEVELTVPKKIATFEFTPDEKEQSAALGENQLILRSVKMDAGECRVQLSLARHGESMQEWQEHSRAFQQNAPRITVLSDTGEELRVASWPMMVAQTATDVSLTGRFSRSNPQGASAVKTVRVEYPSELQTIKAKFEFRDLPMP